MNERNPTEHGTKQMTGQGKSRMLKNLSWSRLGNKSIKKITPSWNKERETRGNGLNAAIMNLSLRRGFSQDLTCETQIYEIILDNSSHIDRAQQGKITRTTLNMSNELKSRKKWSSSSFDTFILAWIRKMLLIPWLPWLKIRRSANFSK